MTTENHDHENSVVHGTTMTSLATIADGAPHVDGADEILSKDALAFLAELHRHFNEQRKALLGERATKRESVTASGTLDFLTETADVRAAEWQVASAPAALMDRRVEITGPAVPVKMAINALNSGANVWLADLEDASSPTWANVIESQVNLRDAARGMLAYTSPEGKSYAIRTDVPLPTVVTRPRAWHLDERHILVDGERASASLVDFGLHFFHTAKQLIANGHGPYYYLPKIEGYREARLWNEVFVFAQNYLGISQGTIRATMLIETIPAAFEMDEILYELRDHASGLNAGRWDYLFSIIKYFRDATPPFILPDRTSITMIAPFMRAYTELLVKTCHHRGAFAMGGMAAFIPNRSESQITANAFEQVREDKSREANDGFDGSWVAHPDLVSICGEVFDRMLGGALNQLDKQRPEVSVTAADLLNFTIDGGTVTEQGVRSNLYVAVAYAGSWLSGDGAVAIRYRMEDAATAEISRSQVWQQLNNRVTLADTGAVLTPELVRSLLDEEIARLQGEVGDEVFVAHYQLAAELVANICLSADYVDFLTIPAYELLG